MPSPRTSPQPRPDAAAAPSGARRALRVMLTAGVVLTVVSGLGLLGALAAYFLHAAPAFLPALYAVSLFGLPLGFTLMVLHVVLSAVLRARS
ncbi:hypothetical protein [Micrococcus porci]|uniref:hypothetical protein n=1 Tax=Micrococcus porci TaxID=2856555 RepID=UPI003CF3256A